MKLWNVWHSARRDPVLRATIGPSAVLLRADATFKTFSHVRTLGALQKFVGERVAIIDICGVFPTKATVLMIDRDAVRKRQPVNRAATILFRGVPPHNRGAVHGDVIVTAVQDPRGLVFYTLLQREEWVTGELAELCAPASDSDEV